MDLPQRPAPAERHRETGVHEADWSEIELEREKKKKKRNKYKTATKDTLLFLKAVKMLLPFAGTYLCETAFSALTNIMTKYRSGHWHND